MQGVYLQQALPLTGATELRKQSSSAGVHEGVHISVEGELNRRFYERAPHVYFQRRLFLLAVMANKGDALDQLAEEPLRLGTVLFTSQEAEGVRPIVESDDDLDAYVTSEAEMLLHHSAEALMRLFLAHRSMAPCPWLEVARLLSFRDFKQAVSEDVVNAPSGLLQEQVRAVFLAESVEVEQQSLGTYESLLRRVGKHLLDRANLYNSAKHGFTVNPSQASLAITPEDSRGIPDVAGGFALGSGPALDYLESERDEVGRFWRLKTTWVDVPRTASLAHLVCRAMGSLWGVARARYLGEGSQEFWAPLVPLEELLPSPSVGGIRSFTRNLGYEE